MLSSDSRVPATNGARSELPNLDVAERRQDVIVKQASVGLSRSLRQDPLAEEPLGKGGQGDAASTRIDELAPTLVKTWLTNC